MDSKFYSGEQASPALQYFIARNKLERNYSTNLDLPLGGSVIVGYDRTSEQLKQEHDRAEKKRLGHIIKLNRRFSLPDYCSIEEANRIFVSRNDPKNKQA